MRFAKWQAWVLALVALLCGVALLAFTEEKLMGGLLVGFATGGGIGRQYGKIEEQRDWNRAFRRSEEAHRAYIDEALETMQRKS